MAYFIKSSRGNGNNINLERVVKISRHNNNYNGRNFYEIYFHITENYVESWSYTLEIMRDSDYECIINNKPLDENRE